MVATVTPKQLMDLSNRGERINLIDVRTPAEFGEVHVDFARNVPLDRLDPKQIAADHAQHAGPIYFVCRSGGRSKTACEQMMRPLDDDSSVTTGYWDGYSWEREAWVDVSHLIL